MHIIWIIFFLELGSMFMIYELWDYVLMYYWNWNDYLLIVILAVTSDLRERLYNEIEPVHIEQSTTKNGDEDTYGAHLAIDLDMSTTSGTGSNGNDWMKITLDNSYCLDRIMWYYQSNVPVTTWTCQSPTSGCQRCEGGYCYWATLEVLTQGSYEDNPRPSCGDTVLMRFDNGNPYHSLSSDSFHVAFTEIAITGKWVSWNCIYITVLSQY